MHKRQEIREAVRALLLGNTSAYERVYLSRVIPLFNKSWHTELPAVMIYTRAETAGVYLSAPLQYERTTTLAVDVVVALPGDGADNDLDDAAEIIERLLLRDDSLGRIVSSIRLTNSTMELRGDNDHVTAALSIEFACTWHYDAPDQAYTDSLPALEFVDTVTDLGGEQAPLDRTENLIEVEQ